MEDTFNEWKRFTKFLSRIIRTNKIPDLDPAICDLFVNYVKENTLKDMDDLLSLFHQLKNHQESNLKLECGIAHCIECYNFFSNDVICDPKNFFCTCSRKIIPKYRHQIMQNYIRIQSLKTSCVFCKETKDQMEFALYGTHNQCLVCTSCIKKTYRYQKNFRNSCKNCNREYDEESEQILKALHERNLSESELAQIYLEQCSWCKTLGDSRKYQYTCEQRHMGCEKCIMENSIRELCICKNPLTILK